MAGLLSVVGTPIGNLDDLSPRAARTLASADIIACEDTRVARTLLTRVEGCRARLVAYHAQNERSRTPELVRAAASGSRVALTTDAGMPGLSDPGHILVAACLDAGIRIEVVPGPSAVTTALVASGFPTARFVFEGFLPRTNAARRRRLEALATEERTIVVFESPHRVTDTLAAMAEVLGDRSAAVVRELTKIHEETIRGRLSELAALDQIRGEITIVLEGAPHEEAVVASEDLVEAVRARELNGETRRDAIGNVAKELNVAKNVVYKAVTSGR